MLFLDDKNPDFDIPYHALVVGKKLGSGGFKDCYTGLLLFWRKREIKSNY